MSVHRRHAWAVGVAGACLLSIAILSRFRNEEGRESQTIETHSTPASKSLDHKARGGGEPFVEPAGVGVYVVTPSGSPVHDAWLVIASEEGGTLPTAASRSHSHARLECDAAGYCLLPPESVPTFVRAAVERASGIANARTWSESKFVDGLENLVYLTIRVPGPVAISGIVTDEEGVPVEGAVVMVRPHRQEWKRVEGNRMAFAISKTITDPAGCYRIVHDLMPGIYSLTVGAHRAGLEPFKGEVGNRATPPIRLVIEESGALREFFHNIVLVSRPVSRVSGTVLRPDGSPLSDARVLVESRSGDPAVQVSGSGWKLDTDASGAFGVETSYDQYLDIHIAHPEYKSVVLQFGDLNPERRDVAMYDIPPVRMEPKTMIVRGRVEEATRLEGPLAVLIWTVPIEPMSTGNRWNTPVAWSIPVSSDGTFEFKVDERTRHSFRLRHGLEERDAKDIVAKLMLDGEPLSPQEGVIFTAESSKLLFMPLIKNR